MSIRFISRGPADQISGGYLYNHYVMAYLRRAGVEVIYHSDPMDLHAIEATDVVIVDSLVVAETAARLLSTSARLLLLLHVVPCVAEPRPDGLRALADLCRRSRLVVTGDDTLQSLRRTLAVPGLDAVKIEPGVPQHWPTKQRYRAKAERLLGLANYVRGKGMERALDVLRGLAGLPWTLTIHGNRDLDPEYFAAIAARTKQHGLDDRIHLHGSVPHHAVNGKMLEADLLVHFSEHESYSTVTAEAIACGLPVFAHRTGNAVAFGKSGLVRYFNGDDANATDQLRALICDASAYAALRRVNGVARRTWQEVGSEFVALLGRH